MIWLLSIDQLRSYCLFVLIVLLTKHSNGQTKFLCHFNHLSIGDGLTSQTYNHHVFQDSDAFVWINSQLGLNRYDGQKIKTYKAKDEPLSLLDNGLNSPFFEDNNNKIWFSSKQAIYQFDPTWQTFHPIKLLPPPADTLFDYQLKLVDPGNNRAWARIRDKLYLFNLNEPRSTSVVWESPRINYRSIVSIDTSTNRTILFSHTSWGIIIKYLDPPGESQKRENFTLAFSQKKTYTSLHNKDSIVWVGLQAGLGRLTLSSAVIESQLVNTTVTNIVGIAQIDSSTLLIATQKKGIYIYNIESNQYTAQIYIVDGDKTQAFQQEIEYIYLAPDRTLWISSQSNGVFYTHLDKVKFTPQFLKDYADTLRASGIKSITEDIHDRLWGISEYNVFIWDKDGNPLPDLFTKINRPKAFNNNKLFTIFADRDGQIWVGTQLGLYIFNPSSNSFDLFPISHPALGRMPAVTSIIQLPKGKLLISTSGEGVIEIVTSEEDGDFSVLPFIRDKLTYNWLYPLDATRFLLNQYGHSLDVYDIVQGKAKLRKKIKHNAAFSGLVDDPTRNIIWIPSDDGLYFIDLQDPEFQIKKDSTFEDMPIHGLLVDREGFVWLSTNSGLIRYDETEKEIKKFNASDGIQGSAFEFASFAKTRQHKLIFGNILGLTVIKPEEVREIKTPARPIINDIRISGLDQKEIRDYYTGVNNPSAIQNLILPYRFNKSLSFSFAPRCYEDPNHTSFQYQLIRNKRDTIDRSSGAKPRFVDLRSGSYLLELLAQNSDGVSNNIPHQIRFTILPPWYITWWAITLYILLLGYLLYRWYRYRIQQVEKKEAEKRREAEYKQKEAEFRQKEAEYKQLVAETETAVLRLQMNPHFLFNSMNSINSYILQKDVDTASYYLTHFAKLMRQILELSEHPFIEIYEERAFLEQYLQAEGMRMGKKLEYQFEVDQDIDQDETLIPTMLLQPFVENAIWHGVSELPAGGLVSVRFLLSGKKLLCEVEDNGVGRKEKSTLRKEHQSKALAITKRRLQLLTENHAEAAHFEIIDLKDQNGEPTGTKVQVFLPILA
jgi:ligand-binding sensor domain-containing protein